MKIAILAVVIILLAASTAFGGWQHVVPVVVPAPTVVYSYYPVGPVYAYPAPVLYPVAPVFYPPAPALVYPRRVVYPAGVLAPAPVVVRTKVFVRGQPVRNVVRAVVP